MSKLRSIVSILKTKNYIVITDTINDGYIKPQFSEEFLTQLEPIISNLKETIQLQRRHK